MKMKYFFDGVRFEFNEVKLTWNKVNITAVGVFLLLLFLA